MIFDHLCGIAERHFPYIVEILKSTRLFVFPYGKDVLKNIDKGLTPEQLEWIDNNFSLPFESVCIEDKCSAVILLDRKRNATGLQEVRGFIELVDGSVALEEFGDNPELKNICSYRKEEEVYSMVTGVISGLGFISYENPEYKFTGSIGAVYLIRKNEIIKKIPGSIMYEILKEKTELIADFYKGAITAMEEITAFNNPFRFIVEVSPTETRNNGNNKKLLRSHDRPSFTLLTPKEIREKMKIPESTHNSPIPHERRRHTRTFRSEKYVNMVGKTIWIPATWVGITERVIGNKKYVVRLDL